MNLTKAEKARLGVFLTVSAGLLVGSALILAGLKAFETRDEYVVSFAENVSGLEPSAQVQYQGFRVGAVTSIQVDPQNPALIEVHLAVDPKTVLYPGTEAVLESSLLTGFKTINLTPGDPKKPRLISGSRLPARASVFEQIGARAEEISVRIERVAANLDEWTSPINRARFESLADSSQRLVDDVDLLVVDVKDPLVLALNEVAKTSASIRNVTDEAQVTLQEARKEISLTLQAARDTLQDLQKIAQALDPKLVRETLVSANTAVRGLEKSLNSEELSSLFADLRMALLNLTRLMQSLDLTVRAGRDDLVVSLKYVRQAAQDIRDFSRIIAQDPSVLLRGTEAQE